MIFSLKKNGAGETFYETGQILDMIVIARYITKVSRVIANRGKFLNDIFIEKK